MSKNIKWLFTEIDKWVKNGVIDSVQGETIKNQYPVPDQGISWGKIIFSTIGAIIFGLGVILLFAYNWEKMSKYAKLGVVFSSLLTAHGFGLYLGRDSSSHKAAGQGLHVLGTMLFGAGIWLVAQIYHIDEHFPNAFVAWSLGALALAWAVPSISQGIIASILMVFWNGFEVFEFRNPNHFASPIILSCILPLAWKLRSRALLGTGICSFILALCFTCSRVDDDLILPVIFFWSCAFIASGIILKDHPEFSQFFPIFSFFGNLPYMAVLYAMSFKSSGKYLFHIDFQSFEIILYFTIPALTAAVLWFIAFKRIISKDYMSDYSSLGHLATPAVLIFFILQAVFGGMKGWPGAAFYNLIYIFHCIMFICHGCKTINIRQTAVGCLLFSLIVLTRYVDLFESLIVRAIIFFFIGTGIFVVGNFYSGAKKKAEGGME
ncbi:DUF2157 domain-containing protein [Desulfobacterales bacterium HSG17]|nr:DUF2157 domain-containing protein [Desulfobacterales bacterium HSG17]